MAAPGPDPALSTFTVAQLTQLYAENRSYVLSEIIRHTHAVILQRVAAGKREFNVDHMYLHSDWLKDAEFRTELESTLQGLFPGSTIALASIGGDDYTINFAYIPASS